MSDRRERSVRQTAPHAWRAAVAAVLLIAGARCKGTGPAQSVAPSTTLRVGVGPIELKAFLENLTVEGLAKVGEDGRLNPWLAKQWIVSSDGLSMVVELRPNLRFHDGSPVTAHVVVDTLLQNLQKFVGVAYEDVASIAATSDSQIEFKLRKPSSFVVESLETQISKPGLQDVGTGPFVLVNASPGELRANSDYYLGKPAIDKITVSTYASTRAAWAEMLRDNLDMLYEVGVDARDSLESSKTINLFSYTRHYQYIVLLNSKSAALRSPAVRRGLNAAIDRSALIQEAMNGHGLVSSGPIWPKHWAFTADLPAFRYDPKVASTLLAGLTFTCLAGRDVERVALVVKHQLEVLGAKMNVEEVSVEQLNEAARTGNFDAILGDAISGPSIFRPYLWWHSRGALNRAAYSSLAVDHALDAVRHSTSDEEYRAGVVDFQRAILEDPPAIFLAWSERARAVSDRFRVSTELGGDILGTLRLWQPVAGPSRAGN